MRLENFSKDRVQRLLECLRGDRSKRLRGTVGIEQFLAQVQPHSPGSGLAWFGTARPVVERFAAASRASITWTSSVVSIEAPQSRDFADHQAEHIDAYRAHTRNRDTGQGLATAPGRYPHRRRPRRDREVPSYARWALRANQGPAGRAACSSLPNYVRHLRSNWPICAIAHGRFQRATRSRSPLAFTFDEEDYLQIVTHWS